MAENPSEPPPPAYSEAPPAGHKTAAKKRNGITPAERRSMEDENRELPEGWVRTYDPKYNHQFFVDTKADPPRSIWHHPYDDDQYLSTLSSEERERIQELARTQSHADIMAESTDEDEPSSPVKEKMSKVFGKSSNKPPPSPSQPAPEVGSSSQQRPGQNKESLGRRWKDKLTGTTHDERAERRRQRAEEEQRMYEAHRAARMAMQRAVETGQPQFLGKDRSGHDVYIEPPQGYGGAYGGGFGSPYGGAYGSRPYRTYNPYSQGPYADPNARFIRPGYAYNRPYGGGYGGGMGLPLAGGAAVGLTGGLLLGGLLGGF